MAILKSKVGPKEFGAAFEVKKGKGCGSRAIASISWPLPEVMGVLDQ